MSHSLKETTVARGSRAENDACAFLVAQGLEFQTKNFRCPLGEIDLIMRDGEYLIFVEVRFRHDPDFGTSIETISKNKCQRIIRTALYYLQQEKLLDKVFCRFDVVGMDAENNLLWIKNAFEVEY